MTHENSTLQHRMICCKQTGFTLIELMIVIAIIAIILALPVYSNYSIRAKISEGVSLANSAVTAVSATCSAISGYYFIPTTHDDDYVESIEPEGPCSDPVIRVITKNNGQKPDPILILTGSLVPNSGQITWRCSSDNTPDWLLLSSCRDS